MLLRINPVEQCCSGSTDVKYPVGEGAKRTRVALVMVSPNPKCFVCVECGRFIISFD